MRPTTISAATAALVTTLTTGAVVVPVSADPRYTITDLGTLGGTESDGAGINARGEVAGQSSLTEDGPTHNGRKMIDIGTLGGTLNISWGQGINASGEVTGTSYASGNAEHAFVYNGATMSPLGTLGGVASYGSGINASGEVTGYSFTRSNEILHAFLYNGTTMQDLGALGGNLSVGVAINDSAEVTGFFCTAEFASTAWCSVDAPRHAFLYNGTTMRDLGTLGGNYSFPQGINNSGEVTGWSIDSNGFERAFLYNGTTMQDLGTLGGRESFGGGINDLGDVVGWSQTGDPTDPDHIFLYKDGTMFDVSTLIVPTDPLFGKVKLSSATGINNTGQIVARGCYMINGQFGECHAFRLDPVHVFAGTPGKSNCHGKSVSELAKQIKASMPRPPTWGTPTCRRCKAPS
jgi:probable HAF family extracellular repeat protein